jgi:hypothetical protein
MAQRIGLRRKSMARNVDKVLQYGMGINDTRGNLRKYLITLSLRTMEYGKDPKVLVYAGYVYIFSSVDDTLITTWEVPKRFIRHNLPRYHQRDQREYEGPAWEETYGENDEQKEVQAA